MCPWTIIAIFCDGAVKLSEELFISECEKLTRKKPTRPTSQDCGTFNYRVGFVIKGKGSISFVSASVMVFTTRSQPYICMSEFFILTILWKQDKLSTDCAEVEPFLMSVTLGMNSSIFFSTFACQSFTLNVWCCGSIIIFFLTLSFPFFFCASL